jgi:hypothetical protein
MTIFALAMNGTHLEFGDYVLTVDAARDPEPSAIALFSIACGVGAVVGWRRKLRRD